MTENSITHDALKKLAAMYAESRALHNEQRAVMAKLIRVCVAQLNSPDSRKRREAIAALTGFAIMLEKPQ